MSYDYDPTERARRLAVALINFSPGSREALEADYGADNVFDTDQVRELFVVHGFMAPYVTVTRKSDGANGTLLFQHSPQFYFDFRS